MLDGTTVSLPAGHDVRFPELCVCCGVSGADGKIRLASFKSDLSWLREGASRSYLAKAPICRRCKNRIYFRQLGILLATLAFASAAYWLSRPLFIQIVSPTLRRLATLGTMLICIVPVCIWEVFRPPAFDVSTSGGAVDYEFRDAAVAAEFAVANSHAEWMKLDGEPFDAGKMIAKTYAQLLRNEWDQKR
jgi:hypothetical protein